jgi:hypothetical protein
MIFQIIVIALALAFNLLPALCLLISQDRLTIVYSVCGIVCSPLCCMYFLNIFRNIETGKFTRTTCDRLGITSFPLVLLIKSCMGFIILVSGLPHNQFSPHTIISYVTIAELIFYILSIEPWISRAYANENNVTPRIPRVWCCALVIAVSVLLFISTCAIIGLLGLPKETYKETMTIFVILSLITYLIWMFTAIAYLIRNNTNIKNYIFVPMYWSWICTVTPTYIIIYFICQVATADDEKNFTRNFFHSAFSGKTLECYAYDGNMPMCIATHIMISLPLALIAYGGLLALLFLIVAGIIRTARFIIQPNDEQSFDQNQIEVTIDQKIPTDTSNTYENFDTSREGETALGPECV